LGHRRSRLPMYAFFLPSDDPLVTGKLVYDWNRFSIGQLAEKEPSHDVTDRSRQPPQLPAISGY